MMGANAAILVIDSDSADLAYMAEILREAGYDAITSESGSSALRQLFSYHPDAVVLAESLCDMDQDAVATRIRDLCDTPIIYLASSGDGSARRPDSSATGYLAKPLNGQQIVERIRAVLNKRNGASDEPTRFEEDGLVIDWKRCEVFVNGEPVHTTVTEFNTLSLLVRRRGWVLTHDQILSNVWGSNHIGDRNNVKLYIWYLRRKIEDDPSNPRWILTKRGIGYSFAESVSDANQVDQQNGSDRRKPTSQREPIAAHSRKSKE